MLNKEVNAKQNYSKIMCKYKPVKVGFNLRKLWELNDTCIIQNKSLETARVELNNFGELGLDIL